MWARTQSLCSAGCDWRLMLICYERKVLVADCNEQSEYSCLAHKPTRVNILAWLRSPPELSTRSPVAGQFQLQGSGASPLPSSGPTGECFTWKTDAGLQLQTCKLQPDSLPSFSYHTQRRRLKAKQRRPALPLCSLHSARARHPVNSRLFPSQRPRAAHVSGPVSLAAARPR